METISNDHEPMRHEEGDDHRSRLAWGKMALDHNTQEPERSTGRDKPDNHNAGLEQLRW
jgi:hypothetical protein